MATTKAAKPLEDGERGRAADGPLQIPRSGWRDIMLRTWNESGADNIGLISAGVAFYGFLAFVPLLAAFVMTYGLIADPQLVAKHLQVVFALLPTDAAKLVGDQMVSVTKTATAKTGLGLVLALALAIYGAMNGAGSVVTALNVVYDEEEGRGIVKTTLLSLGITLSMLVVGILGVVAIGALALVEGLLPGAPGFVLALIRIAFFGAAAIAASAVISAVYRFGPNRRRAKWRWVTPGSLFATVAWVAMTLGFGLYTSTIGNYNATYGALGAVVVLLMWLYLSAYVLLLGAEINSEIEHQTERDTTIGGDRPMGQRGAYVADTLGKVP